MNTAESSPSKRKTKNELCYNRHVNSLGFDIYNIEVQLFETVACLHLKGLKVELLNKVFTKVIQYQSEFVNKKSSSLNLKTHAERLY
jgi:hypothetical protein